MIRHRPAAAFAAALVLVAGCSTSERAEPGTPKENPPNRALVAWSDTVCASVKQVDQLSSERDWHDAVQASSDVDTVLRTLDTLKPSGIKRADTYVTGLVRQLRQLKDELPENDTAPSRADRVTELVDRIGEQKPKLTTLAERTTMLAPSYHLAPSCSQLEPAPELSTRATPKLVHWADTMCAGVASVADLPEPGDELLKDPRFAPFEDWELSSYLSSMRSRVMAIREPLAELTATGNSGADAYRSKMVEGLRNAEKRLPEHTSSFDLHHLSVEQLRTRAQEAADTIAAVPPPGPDLSAIAHKNPALAAAYDLAPRCEPADAKRSGSKADPLPKARDGKNLAACQDGKCQIEVSAPVDVTVLGNVFTTAVSAGTVWIARDGTSLIRLSGSGGEARFGKGDTTVTFSITGSTDTAAVLDVSVSDGG